MHRIIGGVKACLSLCCIVVISFFITSLWASESTNDLPKEFKAGDEYRNVKLKSGDPLPEKYDRAVVDVAVNEKNIVKPYSNLMFGVNFEAVGSQPIVMANENTSYPFRTDEKSLDLDPDYLEIMKGVPLPLFRLAGGTALDLTSPWSWKDMVGPYENRKWHTARYQKKIRRYGIVEWIRTAREVDPKAKFTFILRPVMSPQDCADLAEFLTGDAEETEWGKRRAEYGLPEPVDVVTWELASEIDYWPYKKPRPANYLDPYIEFCRKTMDAIRKVQPDATFTVEAATAAWEKSWHEDIGGWRTRHVALLKALGKDIDYIGFHPYYHGHKVPYLESFLNVIAKDIKSITGSDRIKVFISEHALWPPNRSKGNKEWFDYAFHTHALKGMLATAEWNNRMICRPEVVMQTYHSLRSGLWGMIYRDKESGQRYLTGISDLFKAYGQIEGKNVVALKQKGVRADVTKNDLSFTASAITDDEGLVLILVNREPIIRRKVKFKFRNKYVIDRVNVLTAPDILSHNQYGKKEISVEEISGSPKGRFDSCIVPAKSINILFLKKDS